MYIRDAARALVMLSDAPKESIETVMYLLAGITPSPSAAELADVVRARIPDAQIDFKPDMQIQRALDLLLPLDDSNARREWNWKPNYNLEQTVEDFLCELSQNSTRYE
jgi:nucleoside-diphosphate-sugar epimerase